MNSQTSVHSVKFMSIEEFGRYIELKNHILVEEKKRQYCYIDELGQEYKPLTPKRIQTQKMNLEVLREDESTFISSSSKESRCATLRRKLQPTSKGKPLKLENPFRSIAYYKNYKKYSDDPNFKLDHKNNDSDAVGNESA